MYRYPISIVTDLNAKYFHRGKFQWKRDDVICTSCIIWIVTLICEQNLLLSPRKKRKHDVITEIKSFRMPGNTWLGPSQNRLSIIWRSLFSSVINWCWQRTFSLRLTIKCVCWCCSKSTYVKVSGICSTHCIQIV